MVDEIGEEVLSTCLAANSKSMKARLVHEGYRAASALTLIDWQGAVTPKGRGAHGLQHLLVQPD